MNQDKKIREPKGSGSWTKKSNGKWNLRKKVRDQNNCPVTLSATGPTKAACIKIMASKEASLILQSSRNICDKSITLVELLYEHLNFSIMNREINEMSSIARRRNTIEEIEATNIGQLLINDIDGAQLESLIINLKSINKQNKILSVSSRKKALDVINSAYNYAMVKKYIDNNPIEPLKNKIKSILNADSTTHADDIDVEHLSSAEITVFTQTANETYLNGEFKYAGRNLALFLLNSGLRIGEALDLRIMDYNVETKILKVTKSLKNSCDKDAAPGNKYIYKSGATKNHVSRNIELSDEASRCILEEVNKHINPQPNDYIFMTKNKKHDTLSNATDKINKIFKRANILKANGDIMSGAHVLRHSFATMLYNDGETPIEAVAAYIGDTVAVAQKHYVALRKKDDSKGIHISYPKNQKITMIHYSLE